MLKQILATSALIAIVAVSAQPATAASTGKFRQLVVEAPGTPAVDPLILKKKKVPTLVFQPGAGIATPPETADAGNGGGNKGTKFIVAPSQGIPTQTADAGGGDGNGGGKAVQFVVAPGQGLPTPPDGASQGTPKKLFPTFAKVPGGIATPTQVADTGADPAPTGGSKTFPLIVNVPSGLSTPAGDTGVAAGAPPVAVTPPAGPEIAADAGQADVAAVKAAPVIASLAPAAPAPAPVVANPNDLYSLLTGRGYGVEILKRDASGNLVFYVTAPASPKEADLLLVDGTYGKVIERKHVAAYGYERPAPYTPAHAGDENCDQTAGY
jgi:hypothetical protein